MPTLATLNKPVRIGQAISQRAADNVEQLSKELGVSKSKVIDCVLAALYHTGQPATLFQVGADLLKQDGEVVKRNKTDLIARARKLDPEKLERLLDQAENQTGA